VTSDWQPSCPIESLHQRAELLKNIRDFFSRRSVLEVETPLLSQTTGTDPQLDFFKTEFIYTPQRQTFYLQTSPEFAMKRLLAAGSGSIYQICKAFRNSEKGHYHNPEFSILEWYRVGFDLFDLIKETEQLIMQVGDVFNQAIKFVRLAYVDVFQQQTGLDPLEFDFNKYVAYSVQQGWPELESVCGQDHAIWLDVLFSLKVQPYLATLGGVMVYHYPAVQSSLARLNPDNPHLAERFEVFIDGIEIGNGFHELADETEQSTRFQREQNIRQQRDLPAVQMDSRLLAALEWGLPDCSGIAIGLDRWLMVLLKKMDIQNVISFAVDRA
jgi:lysyl-tRNA synthetase class 2